MHRGDSVIADHPDSRSNKIIRSYGIVQKITKAGVLIKMADGSFITRQVSSIAVFIQPPSNWKDLYEEQKIEFPQSNSIMNRKKSFARQRHN